MKWMGVELREKTIFGTIYYLVAQQRTVTIFLPYNGWNYPSFILSKKEDQSHQSLHLSLTNINFSSHLFSTDKDVITFFSSPIMLDN